MPEAPASPRPSPEEWTPSRNVRIPDAEWAQLGDLPQDRGSLIRRAIAAMLADQDAHADHVRKRPRCCLLCRVADTPDPIGQKRHANLARPTP